MEGLYLSADPCPRNILSHTISCTFCLCFVHFTAANDISIRRYDLCFTYVHVLPMYVIDHNFAMHNVCLNVKSQSILCVCVCVNGKFTWSAVVGVGSGPG